MLLLNVPVTYMLRYMKNNIFHVVFNYYQINNNLNGYGKVIEISLSKTT